jgi:hypothetical protein
MEDQEREIQRLIIDKTPDQLKFPFALWTRKAVQELIKRRYAIDMPVNSGQPRTPIPKKVEHQFR